VQKNVVKVISTTRRYTMKAGNGDIRAKFYNQTENSREEAPSLIIALTLIVLRL
jgi:hypothetical protein